MEDNLLEKTVNDGQLAIKCNVALRVTHPDTNEVETYFYHNRVTKRALLGVIRYIYGDFNDDIEETHQEAAQYTPKYVGIGGYYKSNVPSWKNYVPVVNVNVNSLDHEFPLTGTTHEDRIMIASRQITHNITENFMTLTFRAYISSEIYQNTIIKEAGLFTDSTGDNCWSKINIANEDNQIDKGIHDFVDVLWDVKVASVGATEEEGYLDYYESEQTVTRGTAQTWTITPDFQAFVDDTITPQYPEGDEQARHIVEYGVDGDFENNLEDYGLSIDFEMTPITVKGKTLEIPAMKVTGTPEFPDTAKVSCYYTNNRNKKLRYDLVITVQDN